MRSPQGNFRRGAREGAQTDRDTDDMFMRYKEDAATVVERQIQRHSEIGCVVNDAVEYVRDKYTTERWLYAIQYLEGVDLCC